MARLLETLIVGSLAVTSLVAASPAVVASPELPVRLETRSQLSSHLANIHLVFDGAVDSLISVTYGSCTAASESDAHHLVSRGHHAGAERLVWIIPEDVESGGCLSAWSGLSGVLLGRSGPQHTGNVQSVKRTVQKSTMQKRSTSPHSIPMTNASGIDAWGPWFDGVELLKSTNVSAVYAKEAKSKHVGIVGAGMSGLMTYLCLTQAGMTNVEIIEAGERLGGRVHTVYLSGGPFNYSYQEMGPMRFPTTTTLGNETYNISDHQMVFQLAAEMNKLNNYDKNLSVDFIPWYQSSKNGLYYHNGIRLADGMPPTVAQKNANASLAITKPEDASTTALQDKVDAALPGDAFYVAMAQNMFKAHREWIGNGLDGLPGNQWSEFAYMVNYLKGNLNDTDIVSGGDFASDFWDTLYEGMYFDATTWRTIDGGLNRLPLSFHPLVDNATTLTQNREISRVKYNAEDETVTLQWRDSYLNKTFQNSTYDYAVIAVPFSVIKRWRFSDLPVTMSNAITHVPYTAACKVALEFETRFWEHLDNPIYGSCSTSTDIPGIGSICYPSYNINGTGPATILGSYVSGDQWGEHWVSVSEAEHVQYVLDTIIEIHGSVAREQYTGKFNRRCWALDPLESASWASPIVGQHELYLPEYFKTHNNMIFVGEHTSYTHAWIASALESGIRGSVQLLLELGLVDEAKATAEKWMARWIEVHPLHEHSYMAAH
ncbi:L-amino acid oxidase [Grosmannia clavigera kw1407]|uniref:L-amino acid oxidase n=1 Tax=Grosmannia clavigera (strain kw1407 / UAMH 11150) TaxID=655863 RepID=F0XRX2_GROCL|nr:L-amino acid oxidase [Grosmannia clavigera kw1407]EFW99432.1 L-amino acid oxidase [Grosmannia clavigera kw1407]